LFGRLDARSMVDNDVMVRRRDVARARDVLISLGYEPLPFRDLAADLRTNFQYPMSRRVPGGAPAVAEIHWSAFPPDLYPVSEELLWRHVEPFELRGERLTVFDRPMTIVHLASHFAQHRFSEPRILRDLAAAWNLWGGSIDRSVLFEIARETGLLHALDYTFLSAADRGLLQAEPPRIGSRRAARLRRWLPASRLGEARPRHDYARMLLSLLLVDPRRLPRWILRRGFPPIETMAVIYGRPPSPALYLRYLTRPFRPLRRMLSSGSRRRA
ncbi:MAG: nucleotidyltransferase family protein, partial [Candidatus Binatia bacterium]